MQLKLFNPQATPDHYPGKKKAKKPVSPVYRPQRDLWNDHVDKEQEMALLFLDIRDFTPLTGTVQATDLIHLMQKLLSVFQRIVQNHHGRIIETTGDGFYAAFGFDLGIKESVNDAVRAGSAILKYLDTMNATSFEKNLNRKIEAGIGVHAGNVATGTIKLRGEDHMIVMGQSVNIASRLQAATKELNNNFIISAPTFDMLTSTWDSKGTEINLRGVRENFAVRLIGQAYLH